MVTLDQRSRWLRGLVVDALEAARKGHVGPSMSLIEILRVLYDDFLRVRPEDPAWAERDRLILSKGHGCLALYAVLADKGFMSTEELKTFGQMGTRLGGHPEASEVPGVELSTGSLGHGLSVAVGMAMAARITGATYRTVVVTGDGELNEGSIWEAAMSASHHGLDNLTVFVDHNGMQSYGPLGEVIEMGDLVAKWSSFGFQSIEVDGHDVRALRDVAGRLPLSQGSPTAVICRTVKGKGLRLAENVADWHFRFGVSDDEIEGMRNDTRNELVDA